MKKLMLAFAVLVLALGMFVESAEARRLGGSRSFGMNRSSPAMSREATPSRPTTPTQNATQSTAPASAPAASAPRAGASRWLGPIAGLAAGIGLAALLSHFGMGEGVANFLLIALVAMAAIFLLRRLLGGRPAPQAMPRTEPVTEPVTMGAGAGQAPLQFDAQKVGAGETAQYAHSAANAAAPAGAGSMPVGFDAGGFLRQAKLNFARLQAANDRGDMEDIRQFSTPEVAAEIQLQFQERQRAQQQTDIVQLDADLLEIITEAQRHIASVRFHGLLREEADSAPLAFSEIWHLVKPDDGQTGWLVAGIQQD
jgi:predicted lipid-binding transport protein (Tim44 family)